VGNIHKLQVKQAEKFCCTLQLFVKWGVNSFLILYQIFQISGHSVIIINKLLEYYTTIHTTADILYTLVTTVRLTATLVKGSWPLFNEHYSKFYIHLLHSALLACPQPWLLVKTQESSKKERQRDLRPIFGWCHLTSNTMQ